MPEEDYFDTAKDVYDKVCETLDERGWKYENFEEDLVVRFVVQGKALTSTIIINADGERRVIRLLSRMTFTAAENRLDAVAVAVGQVNGRIADASFDLDYLNGNVTFRMASSFRDSIINKALLGDMIDSACKSIDEYGKKLFTVSEREMSYGEIVDYVK